MAEVTLGGQRLGSGGKNKIHLRNYERSTHDLSYIWRSTMACGTLVPFMSEVGLPGDTFDIDLNCDVLTHPTIGPLFGNYKIQLDVFQIPIRLYQGKLHMNMLGIGMDMSAIKLPVLTMFANKIDQTKEIDNQQVNPSCIFSYLGIRGIGNYTGLGEQGARLFNAIPYLGYWDIYKQYYANKQEEIGIVIHKDLTRPEVTFTGAQIEMGIPPTVLSVYTPDTIPIPPYTYNPITFLQSTKINVFSDSGLYENYDTDNLWFYMKSTETGAEIIQSGRQLFSTWEIMPESGIIIGTNPTPTTLLPIWEIAFISAQPISKEYNGDSEPELTVFPLSNIDQMRQDILSQVGNTNAFNIDKDTAPPYGLALDYIQDPENLKYYYTKNFSQEGLAIKTYQSDLFNNWISTEWIDGENGISAITAIDTTDGSFTIDELNLSKKVYDMLNRIALSGGSYDDWLDAVYTHDRQKSIENPVYLGGLIKNLIFQEVISNSGNSEQPLGTLAGRGRIGNKHKGGKIIAKIDEPSYLMGIISITPIIDYSQGNKWDVNLETMNDFHKPALDEIGFQDLVTEQMAWWDTEMTEVAGTPIFKSAGKQPAWINYMTNTNVVRGNFADQSQQMFMVLNRRYEANLAGGATIKDLTTYIDPVKFNHIFADTRRDAQNFWTQISVNIEARRKMSAKVIPNL